MAYYSINLVAGKEYQQQAIGRVLLIDSIGASPGVDVTLVINDASQKTIPARRAGFKYVAPFTKVIFKSPVDCVLNVFLSKDDVDLGLVDGAKVTVQGDVSIDNDASSPVPVSMVGTVSLTATNVGVNNSNAAAVPVKNQALGTIVDYSEVTIAGVVSISLINDATLRRLRFRNSHASAVIVLGGASVTMTNSPIRLLPGETFIEEDAAGADWHAITDTPGATIQLQGLK